jgi:hypothetical protein
MAIDATNEVASDSAAVGHVEVGLVKIDRGELNSLEGG